MSLATLAQYKVTLPGTAFTDAEIQAGLDAASSLIERYCERTFASTAYAVWLDSRGGRTFCLPNYPVTILRSVSVTSEDMMSLQNTSAGAVDAVATVDNDSLILTVRGGANDGTSVLTLATYTTLALLGAAITALGKSWSWTVTYECAPVQLRPQSCGSVLNTLGYLSGPYESATFDSLDNVGGMLTREGGWPTGRATVFVDYTAGYATIPNDLQMCCIGMVADLLGRAGHDGSMQSERLGDYQYTIASISATDEPGMAILNPYRAILDSYKRRALQWR